MTEHVTTPADAQPAAPDVIVRGEAAGFLQQVTSGEHQFEVDEPASLGGSDRAPTPYDYLLAALGSCTSMTVAVYARGKKWPLQRVTVSLWHTRVHARDCAECDTKEGMLDRIEMQIEVSGDLTQAQREKLMEIAGKCPVHRTLKSEIDIRKRAGDSAPG
jgi:putative redox protein